MTICIYRILCVPINVLIPMMNDECRMKKQKPRMYIRGSEPPIILVLLTIFAGRDSLLSSLAPQPLGMTNRWSFRRTCGTYGQLLDWVSAAYRGFVPLHHSLVQGAVATLQTHTGDAAISSLALRHTDGAGCVFLFSPNVAGAQHLFSPPRLHLVLFRHSCSSIPRDAKMHHGIPWPFVALNSACVLSWFRSSKSTAWLCWVATRLCRVRVADSLRRPGSGFRCFCYSRNARCAGRQMLLPLAGGVDPFGSSGLLLRSSITGKMTTACDGSNSTTAAPGRSWARFYFHHRHDGVGMKDADINCRRQSDLTSARGCRILVIFVAACLPWPKSWQNPTSRF